MKSSRVTLILSQCGKRTMFNKTVVFIIGFIIVTVFGVPVFGAAGIIGGIFVGAFICIQGRLTHNYT